MSRSLVFSLAIPADEMLRLYSGKAKQVQANTADGRLLRFPAVHLRSFVTHEGVHGTFRIYFDANERFQRLEKIESC